MKLALILGAAALVAGTMASAAEDDTALEPSTPWGVDYGDNQCTLYRTFGAGDQPITLHLEQYVPDGDLRIRVMGQGLEPTWQPMKILIEPEAKPTIDARAVYFKSDDGMGGGEFGRSIRRTEESEALFNKAWSSGDWKDLVAMTWTSAERAEREAEMTHLEVKDGFTKRLILHIGKMPRAFDALRGCMDDLIGKWGIDAKAHRTLSRRAVPANDPGEWIAEKDFPRRLGADNEVVRFRFIVSPEGKPESCSALGRDARADLTEYTCNLLVQRARFNPALDSAGNPIRGIWSQQVLWQKPR